MRAAGSYSGLTMKEAELLSFLRTREANCQPQPTFVEMRDEVDVASFSTISRLLNTLEERNFITRTGARRPVIACVDRPVKDYEVSREVVRSQLAPFTLSQLIDEIGARGLKVMAA